MQLQDIKLGIIVLGYIGLPLAVESRRNRSFFIFDINFVQENYSKF
jgi:UDP-N-acetyl-D-mannosaminuronate dehydrogenase